MDNAIQSNPSLTSNPPISSTPSPAEPPSKPNQLPAILLIAGLLILVIGIVFLTINQNQTKKQNAQYTNPFLNQQTQTQEPSPTYGNPFTEPTPTYANPFNETTNESSSTPYQNPFEGKQ